MDIIPLNGAEFAGQSVAYTGTAGTVTNAWAPEAKGVMVWVTTDAYIRVANDPTATSADYPIPAFTPVTFATPQNGGTWKVSAIRVSASGTLYAKPVGGV